MPISLLKTPPSRVLDDSDLHCTSFGLSFFDSHEHASGKFQSLTTRLRQHLRDDFKAEKGEYTAEIHRKMSDGLADEPEPKNFGHFTFHESTSADLAKSVVKIRVI